MTEEVLIGMCMRNTEIWNLETRPEIKRQETKIKTIATRDLAPKQHHST